jgi:predicted acyltransferase (DUF342 family)
MRMRNTIKRICVFVLLNVSLTQAVSVTAQPDAFTVLAGRDLKVSGQVTVNGSVAASGDIFLAGGASLYGDAYSDGRIRVGKESFVQGRLISSGSMSLGNFTETGSLDSGQCLRIGAGSVVHGDAAYAGEYFLSPSAVVEGSVSTSPDSWELLPVGIPGFSEVAGDQLKYGRDVSETITPGSYDSLAAAAGATLYLTAGSYNFNSVKLGSDVKIIADTTAGEVNVICGGKFTTSGNVIFEDLLDGGFNIYAGGNMSLGSNNNLAVQLNCYSNMNVARDTYINGSVYSSGDICLGARVVIDNNAYAKSMVMVPEPASMALLAGSLLYLARRRIC